MKLLATLAPLWGVGTGRWWCRSQGAPNPGVPAAKDPAATQRHQIWEYRSQVMWTILGAAQWTDNGQRLSGERVLMLTSFWIKFCKVVSTTNSVAHSWEVCGLVRLSRRLRPNRVRHVTRGTNEEWSRPDHGTTPQAPAALIFKDASAVAPVGFPIDHQASNHIQPPTVPPHT